MYLRQRGYRLLAAGTAPGCPVEKPEATTAVFDSLQNA